MSHTESQAPRAAVPRDEIDLRIGRLREALRHSPVSAVLALQRAEVIYFGGTPQDGIVWIPREGDPIFLVRRDVERARCESPIARVIPFSRPADIPGALAAAGLRVEGPVGSSLDVLPVKIWRSLSRALGVAIEDVSREVRGTRVVKSGWELARVREAGALADRIFEFAKERLQTAVAGGRRPREIDLAADLDAFLIRAGSVAYYRTRTFNLEFATLCCLAGESGDWRGPADSPNGAGRGPDPAFGQGSSDREIRRGDPILVDLGTNRGGYYADTTRLFVWGELPERLTAAQRTAEGILSGAVEDVEGGRPLEEVYLRSVERARSAGLDAEFMGGSRFLGHGVGLEIDEWPVVAEGFEEPLPEGAVLSLEPKFALPGGIVGVETTFILEGGRMQPVVKLPPGAERVG